MSNTPDTTVAPAQTNGEAPVEKTAFYRKPLNFVKKHPKIATAVGLGVVLIGAAALTGNQPADSNEPSPEALEEAAVALEEMGVPVTEDVN